MLTVLEGSYLSSRWPMPQQTLIGSLATDAAKQGIVWLA